MRRARVVRGRVVWAEKVGHLDLVLWSDRHLSCMHPRESRQDARGKRADGDCACRPIGRSDGARNERSVEGRHRGGSAGGARACAA